MGDSFERGMHCYVNLSDKEKSKAGKSNVLLMGRRMRVCRGHESEVHSPSQQPAPPRTDRPRVAEHELREIWGVPVEI